MFSFASAPAFSYFCEVKVDDMIDIACCIDSNYAKYCCVMLTSLLENNKGEQVSVHVLGNRLDADYRRSLQELVEERYGQQIHFYEIDSLLLDVFPETRSYVSFGCLL